MQNYGLAIYPISLKNEVNVTFWFEDIYVTRAADTAGWDPHIILFSEIHIWLTSARIIIIRCCRLGIVDFTSVGTTNGQIFSNS